MLIILLFVLASMLESIIVGVLLLGLGVFFVAFDGDYQSWTSSLHFDNVEEGDLVYVIVKNNRPKKVLIFYNMDDYEYVGNNWE